MNLSVFTLAQRPELRGQLFSAEFAAALPEFMRHDPTAELYYARGNLDRYLDFVLAAVHPEQPDRVVARAASVPFAFGSAVPERSELPDGGWDEVIRWAHQDTQAGRPATAVGALEIMVLRPYRGRGVSQRMLSAMADNARMRGFADLYAPVRPSDKHREPFIPFAEYVGRMQPDGLPDNAWLRVHCRAGGAIVKIAPTSMVIAGNLKEWSSWTGLGFEASGAVAVPGALSPLHVSLEQNHAVYVEPNLWVRHRLDRRGHLRGIE